MVPQGLELFFLLTTWTRTKPSVDGGIAELLVVWLLFPTCFVHFLLGILMFRLDVYFDMFFLFHAFTLSMTTAGFPTS